MAWGTTAGYGRLLDFDTDSLGGMPDGPWAMGILFRFTEAPESSFGLLTAGGGDAGSNLAWLLAGADGPLGSLRDADAGSGFPATTSAEGLTDWHLAVIGRDGDNAAFVAFDDAVTTDGELVDAFGDHSAWLVGAMLDDGTPDNPPSVLGSPFPGALAEWWRVDREVTPAELEALAAFTPPEDVFGSDLVWHYRMDGDPAEGDADSSGNLAFLLEAVGDVTDEEHPVNRGGEEGESGVDWGDTPEEIIPLLERIAGTSRMAQVEAAWRVLLGVIADGDEEDIVLGVTAFVETLDGDRWENAELQDCGDALTAYLDSLE